MIEGHVDSTDWISADLRQHRDCNCQNLHSMYHTRLVVVNVFTVQQEHDDRDVFGQRALQSEGSLKSHSLGALGWQSPTSASS